MDIIWIVAGLLVGLFVWLLTVQLRIWFDYKSCRRTCQTMPGDSIFYNFPFGALYKPSFPGRQYSSRFGPIYHIQSALQPIICLASSDLAAEFYSRRKTLKRTHDHGLFGGLAKDVFGAGIGFLDGDRWRSCRANFKQDFTAVGITEQMQHVVDGVNSWARRIVFDGAWVDKKASRIDRLPFEIFARAMYGGDLTECDIEDLNRMAATEARIVSQLMAPHVRLPFHRFLPTKLRSDIRMHRAEWKAFNLKWLEKVQDSEQQKLRSDIFTHVAKRYLGSADTCRNNEEALSSQFFETIAEAVLLNGDIAPTALINALLLIAVNREVHDELAKEIRDATRNVINGNREITAELITMELPYFEAVMKECARLMPVLALTFPEKTDSPMTLGGFHIPAGSYVAIDCMSVNYEETFWPEPERFDPMRFIDQSPGSLAKRFHRYGLDPMRHCLGFRYAEAIVKGVIIRIMSAYDIHLKADGDPEQVWQTWKTQRIETGFSLMNTRASYPQLVLRKAQ